MIKYEVRGTVKRIKYPIKLVPAEELNNYTGFRSVYGYTSEACDFITSNGSTAGLDNFEVYADELLIDFDDAEEQADKLSFLLRKMNINFKRFCSGGRSSHFHINIVPISSTTTNFRQRNWVEKHAPGADMSVYAKSSIFRLEGTYHQSYPGQKKVLTDENGGDILDIPDEGVSYMPYHTNKTRTPEESLIWAKRLSVTHIESGTTGRNLNGSMILWRCREAGVADGDAETMLNEWNVNYCNPPLSDEQIDYIVRKIHR